MATTTRLPTRSFSGCERLHKAIAGAAEGVPREIVERQLKHFAKADPAYADGVKKVSRH